jgi:hypothetical protein
MRSKQIILENKCNISPKNAAFMILSFMFIYVFQSTTSESNCLDTPNTPKQYIGTPTMKSYPFCL